MRRLIVLVTAVGVLAAASSGHGDHTVALSPDEPTAVVDGIGTVSVGAGVNCRKAATEYCETAHVAVTNPVEDTDPSVVESRDFRLDVDITAEVPGSDFDLWIYVSDAAGQRHELIEVAHNWPMCAQVCGTPAAALYTMGTICEGVDECVSITGTTREDAETSYYLVQVRYYSTALGYRANFAYAGL